MQLNNYQYPVNLKTNAINFLFQNVSW